MMRWEKFYESGFEFMAKGMRVWNVIDAFDRFEGEVTRLFTLHSSDLVDWFGTLVAIAGMA